MEKILINVNDEPFSIEYEEKNGWLDGNVYAAVNWKSLATGETGWSYQSKSHGGETHEVINDDCRIMFSFLFVWRGVWEGRIYFKDDEYWSEELSIMAGLWSKLDPILRDRIRQIDPGNTYDD